jgi:hypothetical protein
MAYEYDIFISYRRHPETLAWVRAHFLPLVEHWVGLELGRDPLIFVHEVQQRFAAGGAWPVQLRRTLGGSRVLVALWTKNYFTSRWCVEEFAHMLGRELVRRSCAGASEFGLLIPVVIHDGTDFPAELNDIERIEIQRFYNTRMSQQSPLAEEFAASLRDHAWALAGAIRHAPTWRRDWPTDEVDALFDRFYRPASVPLDVPVLIE